MVAEWLEHSLAILEVKSSRPNFSGISEIYFSNLSVSGTEGLKMVCEAIQELTVTCNVSGDYW